MLIEVTGTDGSGKMTLIHRLRRRLNESKYGWAYERTFQSDQLRILEQIALDTGARRPNEIFGNDAVELVRTLELLQVSHHTLAIHKTSERQVFFIDSYYHEALARLDERSVSNGDLIRRLLHRLPAPDLTIYLRISPQTAESRMRLREKGDSLLLAKNPSAAIETLSVAIERTLEHARGPVLALDAELTPEALVDEVLASELFSAWQKRAVGLDQ